MTVRHREPGPLARHIWHLRYELVQSLEQGRTANPRLSTLLGLASALGVSLGELVGEGVGGTGEGEVSPEEAGKRLPILE
jgi:hypothetical protein